MKYKLVIFFVCSFLVFSFSTAKANSEIENKDEDPIRSVMTRSLKESAFVIETDSNSASESLNRISGEIDMGFATPSSSYSSDNHHKPGPQGLEEAELKKIKNS